MLLGHLLKRKHRTARADFEGVVLPHLDALYCVASRLTANQRDAEDLVQDCLLRAVRFFDHLQEGGSPKAWLLKILHHCFIDRYRTEARDRALCDFLEPGEGQGATVSIEAAKAARDPEAALLKGLFSEDVKRALELLPEGFREVIVLCDLEELSYQEIAEIMDCPIGTVMSRLYRARRQLQNDLRSFARDEGIIRGDQPPPPVESVAPRQREGRSRS